MRTRRHILGKIIAPAIIVAAAILNLATGGRVFTQFPDANLARMKSYESSTKEVFQDANLDADQPPALMIDNAFHFGWLPSGFSVQALSVLSVAVLSGSLFLLSVRRHPDQGGQDASQREFQTLD